MITKNENGSFTISADMLVETTIGKREGGKTLQALLGDFPANAVEKFLRYGFQRVFNDKIGGSDSTVDEKVKEASEMIERFKAGNVGRAPGLGAVDPIVGELRAAIRKNLRAKSPDAWKRLNKLEAREQAEKLDAIFAGQSEDVQATLTAAAKKEIARKQSEAKKVDAIDLGNVVL